MNKLNQYRNKEANKWENTADQYNETFLWKTGFDAAIALDLPVKFNTWYLGEYLPAIVHKSSSSVSKEDVDLFLKWKETTYEQEKRDKLAYQYWIENIYKPE